MRTSELCGHASKKGPVLRSLLLDDVRIINHAVQKWFAGSRANSPKLCEPVG